MVKGLAIGAVITGVAALVGFTVGFAIGQKPERQQRVMFSEL